MPKFSSAHTLKDETRWLGCQNVRLSEQRAQSVQAALLERGVATTQVSAVGKGEGTPIANNDTDSGRQQNRRVELIFAEDGTHTGVDRP